MLILVLLFLATLFLAYSNGANDNFKGVATLFGSGTTNYKRAIGWATATTLAGSLCSIFLAETLVKNFSGKGLVPDALTVSPQFLLAVALGGGDDVEQADGPFFVEPVRAAQGGEIKRQQNRRNGKSECQTGCQSTEVRSLQA